MGIDGNGHVKKPFFAKTFVFSNFALFSITNDAFRNIAPVSPPNYSLRSALSALRIS